MESAPDTQRHAILINLSSLILCRGLEALLREILPDCPVAAATHVGNLNSFRPDTILVDFRTIGDKPHAQWPGAKLVLIDTGLPEEEIISLILCHKLAGVIATGSDLPLFAKALRVIHEGQFWIDSASLKAFLKNPLAAPPSRAIDSLSKKERDIVLLVAEGDRNREIAGKLCISEQTVKSHIGKIFSKINVSSRAQLVPLALKIKLNDTE